MVNKHEGGRIMPIWAIVLIVVAVLIVLWIISGYNKLVKLRNKVEEAFSTMDVYLKKRYDLIPNLVETIKGYTKHESATLEKVVAARNLAVGAKGMDERIASEQKLQTMMGPLYAISESYPELKADRHYTELMSQLKNIEGEITNARKFYNAVVLKFNNAIEVFPRNLIAGMFHFSRKPLYEIEDAAQRENVKVQF